MKKKNILTADELSQISGKTKRAIYKNKNIPYDDSEGQRLYNIKDPLIKKWLNGEPISPTKKADSKIKSKATVKKKISNKKLNTKPAKKNVKASVISEGDIPDNLKKLADSGQLTFAKAMTLSKYELECIKLYEQIKEIKVKADDKRGLSIDRRLIKTVFSKMYEIEMNQLLPLKEKLIPDLSAVYGVKNEKLNIKAGKKLDDEIWKILANIKIELNKFLKKCGEGEI